jgi:catechol 2,3-dioxygenase-like lactoylglutathione lyase family enzyme
MTQSDRNLAASGGGLPSAGMGAFVPELDVTDLAQSLGFWVDLLGFRVAYDRPAAKFAYLERGVLQVMLCEINGEWMTGALERPFGRGVNFQMAVTDLDQIVARLAAADWPLFRPLEEKTYRIGAQTRRSREMLVQDPDGYLLRFAQSLPSEEGAG